MENALAIALEHTRAQGAEKIHRIELHVGELSGVVPEALAFAFDVVSAGTVAEGAELVLKAVPVRCYCDRCRREFQPSGWVYECPDCHGVSDRLCQGQALELASLEVS